MKLIIGLGNPGVKYQYTRHNIGFLALDYIRKLWQADDFTLSDKFNAELSEVNLNGEKILLVRPMSYMNLSGEIILKITQFYKLSISECIVIYDDKDMEFGKIRYRENGSSGGQNGIKNIITHFGSSFARLKIGIGNNPNYQTADWVLSKMSVEELESLEQDVFPDLMQRVSEFIQG